AASGCTDSVKKPKLGPVDGQACKREGVRVCPVCGQEACAEHRAACAQGGRQVCTADLGESRRCATCAQLAAIADLPEEVITAARAVTGAEGPKASRAWRMARDRSHMVVEVDLGLRRKTVFTLR